MKEEKTKHLITGITSPGVMELRAVAHSLLNSIFFSSGALTHGTSVTHCQSSVPLPSHRAFMGLLFHLHTRFLSDGSQMDFPQTVDAPN